MKRAWGTALVIIVCAVSALYAAWWWATAVGAAEVIVAFARTALVRWTELDGWRRWYAFGGAITYALVLVRLLPPLLLWAWRELRPTFTGVIIGIPVAILVFFAVPLLATVAIVVAWPLVLYWLLLDLRGLHNRKPASTEDASAAG